MRKAAFLRLIVLAFGTLFWGLVGVTADITQYVVRAITSGVTTTDAGTMWVVLAPFIFQLVSGFLILTTIPMDTVDLDQLFRTEDIVYKGKTYMKAPGKHKHV